MVADLHGTHGDVAQAEEAIREMKRRGMNMDIVRGEGGQCLPPGSCTVSGLSPGSLLVAPAGGLCGPPECLQ